MSRPSAPARSLIADPQCALMWWPGLPPTGNHAWRMIVMGRSPRIVLTAHARAFFADFDAAWKRLKLPRFGDRWVVLETYFVMPDRRTRDAHNILKLIGDALQKAGVVENDMRVLEQTRMVRIVGDEAPKAWPCSWTLTPEAIGEGGRFISDGVLLAISPAALDAQPGPKDRS